MTIHLRLRSTNPSHAFSSAAAEVREGATYGVDKRTSAFVCQVREAGDGSICCVYISVGGEANVAKVAADFRNQAATIIPVREDEDVFNSMDVYLGAVAFDSCGDGANGHGMGKKRQAPSTAFQVRCWPWIQNRAKSYQGGSIMTSKHTLAHLRDELEVCAASVRASTSQLESVSLVSLVN